MKSKVRVCFCDILEEYMTAYPDEHLHVRGTYVI